MMTRGVVGFVAGVPYRAKALYLDRIGVQSFVLPEFFAAYGMRKLVD